MGTHLVLQRILICDRSHLQGQAAAVPGLQVQREEILRVELPVDLAVDLVVAEISSGSVAAGAGGSVPFIL
jgi:hypothetical protein